MSLSNLHLSRGRQPRCPLNKNKKDSRYLLYPLFFLLIPIVLLSCKTPFPVPDPPKDRVIKNVPFYPQEMFQCGPAALAETFNFWGKNILPEEIARDIYSQGARGTLTMDMILYSEKKGFAARQYSGSVEDVRKNIDLGYPLILLVDYGFSIYQKNHYLVVLGYTEDGLWVHSGREQEKFIPLKDFLGPWEKTTFWTLQVIPKAQVK